MSLVKFQIWLRESAVPFWISHGFSKKNNGFVETLDLEGRDLEAPQRAMVQARQLYFLQAVLENAWAPQKETTMAFQKSLDFLVDNYRGVDGSFAHSYQGDQGLGSILDSNPDFYTQAFALFGMASGYSVTQNNKYKQAAIDLFEFLNKKRRNERFGFFEQIKGSLLFQANPHMHLFEAALSWRALDPQGPWDQLLDEIFSLCTEHFVDQETGFLCEDFDSHWRPRLENNRFVAEPGHLYEWSWLLSQYEVIRKLDSSASDSLLLLALKFGQAANTSRVIDEIWSDGTPKAETSRLWPQCEKLKCLARIYKEQNEKNRKDILKSQFLLNEMDATASELMKFFNTPVKGLWFDRLESDRKVRVEKVKASSLYHIIGAAMEVASLWNL